MSESPTEPSAKPKVRFNLNPADVLADAAIVRLRRRLPENFGVDLPQTAPPSRREGDECELKAFSRALVSTRLDRSGARIRTLALFMFVAYAVIGAKLIMLGLSSEPPQTLKVAVDHAASGARPDLLDRNGQVLATDVRTLSVFAEPRRIIDKDEAVELITAVLPDVNAKELRERLSSKKGFVWVKRQVTPKEQQEIFHLGLPGVGFVPENKRVYPNGPIGAHVIGFVDKDNIGIAGMEKYLDQQSLTDPHVAGFTVDPDSPQTRAAFAGFEGDARASRRARGGPREISGQGGRGSDHRRQYRRNHRAGVPAGLRSQRPSRHDQGEQQGQDQPRQRRRLRDGIDLQGDLHLDGAQFGQGKSRLAHRCARQLALRTLHDL